ncbi:MAG: hypothetical protein DMG09_17780 [Acidobacteria bacterium]|nr:MAG: hypothetical protein DMG09_17780 [Acidobacteriota bacterium]
MFCGTATVVPRRSASLAPKYVAGKNTITVRTQNQTGGGSIKLLAMPASVSNPPNHTTYPPGRRSG